MRLKRSHLQETKSKVPLILITIGFWLGLGIVIYFFDPESLFALPLFFALMFSSLYLSFYLLLKTKTQGLVFAISICIFLLLRLLGVGNLLNFLLIAGVVIAIEIYINSL